MIKFFLLFFYFVSLNADDIALGKSKINQKKEQHDIFGYRECCGNNLFWCKNALSQVITISTSSGFIFIIHRFLAFSPRREGGEIVQTTTPSFLNCFCFLTASCGFLYPYLCRYYDTGSFKPTCYKTAFFSPCFFIEVPYFFYQNRKKKELDKIF